MELTIDKISHRIRLKILVFYDNIALERNISTLLSARMDMQRESTRKGGGR